MPPTRTSPLPGGAIRTHTVADAAMVASMGRAEYAGKRVIWWILGPAFVVGPPAWSLVEYTFGSGDLDVLTLVLSPVFGAMMLAVFAVSLIFMTGPRQSRLRIPVGTPIYADIGPEWIGFGYGEVYNAMAVEQIARVRHIASSLVITGGHTTLVIPDELVPPATRERLTGRVIPQPGSRRPPTSHPIRPRVDVRDDGAVRTVARADAALPDRLARATRRSPGVLLTAATAPMPLLGVVLFDAAQGGLTRDGVILGLCMTLVILGVLAYYSTVGVRAHFRREVPAGSAMSTEIGRDEITIRLGGRIDVVRRCSIVRVTHVRATGSPGVLVLTCIDPVGGFLVPEELVPTHLIGQLRHRRALR